MTTRILIAISLLCCVALCINLDAQAGGDVADQIKKNKWKSGNITDVKVATFGPNAAVSHYTFTYNAELQGKHRARTVICSDTWINDSGTWKTASTHCSLVKGE